MKYLFLFFFNTYLLTQLTVKQDVMDLLCFVFLLPAFLNLPSSRPKLVQILEHLTLLSPENLIPYVEVLSASMSLLLEPAVPRCILQAVKKLWVALNTVMPRRCGNYFVFLIIFLLIFLEIQSKVPRRSLVSICCSQLRQCTVHVTSKRQNSKSKLLLWTRCKTRWTSVLQVVDHDGQRSAPLGQAAQTADIHPEWPHGGPSHCAALWPKGLQVNCGDGAPSVNCLKCQMPSNVLIHSVEVFHLWPYGFMCVATFSSEMYLCAGVLL